MTDIDELRRLAQAALAGPDGTSLNWLKLLQDFQQKVSPTAVSELLDRLEAAEKSDAESIAMYRKARDERDNLRIENDTMRAEVLHIKEVEFPRKAQAVADSWRGKCERLEAKIAEMEKQEPVAEWVDGAFDQYPHLRWRGPYRAIVGAKLYTKFYALPGAQPAPSVPDVDAMAQFIREVDGSHQLGAGVLAERIAEWLKAAPGAEP